MKKFIGLFTCVLCSLCVSSAFAEFTLTQDTTAPTYSTLLTFDEPGGPTGPISTDAFADIGIASLDAGDGNPQVGDFTSPPGGPWVGDGNSFFGNFGVFINFAQPVSALSANIWDPSGPPGPIGGGLGVFLFEDGNPLNDPFSQPEFFIEPAWGGIGQQALNVVGNNGSTFDELRFVGFGFEPLTFMDDLSFDLVPEPSSFVLLSGVLLLLRRRRC